MTDLLKKDAMWVWTEYWQEAFGKLKQAIVMEPVLRLPGFKKTKTLEVNIDASDKAIGGIVAQEGTLLPLRVEG